MIDLVVLASGSGGASSRNAILDLLIVLSAAALVTMSLHRLKLAAIPGYLITGALIGPFALGLIRDDANIEQIKGLSTVLLMFIIGLHLDISAIRTGLLSMLTVGVVSTVGVMLLFWPVAMALGASAPAGLALAMAMSMSSTAVGLRMLQQRREMHRLHGRLVVGISVVQDLLSLAMLAMLPLLGTWATRLAGGAAGGEGLAAADAAAVETTIVSWVREQAATVAGPVGGYFAAGMAALAGIAVLILFGRYLLPRMLGEAAREQSGESSLVLAAAVALGAAVLTAALGLSPELGAFMAGFLLASTPFRYQLAGQLAPMRDLMMAIFFTTVGLKLNFGVVLGGWYVVLIGLVAVVAVKGLVIALSVWAAGATPTVAGRTGLALANAGEFSLVVLAVAETAKVTNAQKDALAIAVVVLSLVLAPMMFTLSDRLSPWLGRLRTAPWLKNSALREHHEGGHAEGGGQSGATDAAGRAAGTGESAGVEAAKPVKRQRAVIAGFGVVGRAVADHLDVHGVPYTVVELNPMTIQTQKGLGRHAVYGDIGNATVLEAIGIESCDAVFLTVPDDDAVLRACQHIRSLAPHVHIVARTSFLSTAFQATGAGADDVSIAEVAVAEDMVKKVLRRLKSTSA
jgi:monovalent cation:H+ antiporter-2, CPA2 family